MKIAKYQCFEKLIFTFGRNITVTNVHYFFCFVFKDNPTLKKYKIGTINELAENKTCQSSL
jgi:hypothetical protein